MQWLLSVEQAYMSRVGDISTGEFDFEPLKSESAGPPIYLSRLSNDARVGYARDLDTLAAQLPRYIKSCRKPAELEKISRCLENIQADLRSLG